MASAHSPSGSVDQCSEQWLRTWTAGDLDQINASHQLPSGEGGCAGKCPEGGSTAVSSQGSYHQNPGPWPRPPQT